MTFLTIEYHPRGQSRGMKFAEEQLLKHGWTQGDSQGPSHPPTPSLPSAQGEALSWINLSVVCSTEEEKLKRKFAEENSAISRHFRKGKKYDCG